MLRAFVLVLAAEFSGSLVNLDVSQKKIEQSLSTYGGLLKQVRSTRLIWMFHNFWLTYRCLQHFYALFLLFGAVRDTSLLRHQSTYPKGLNGFQFNASS